MMKPEDKIKTLLRQTYQGRTMPHDDTLDEQVLRQANRIMRTKSPGVFLRLMRKGRQIMKTSAAKISTGIAALLLMGVMLTCWDDSSRAWSVEQTIEAIKSVQTMHVKGVAYWDGSVEGEKLPFDFWVKFPQENDGPLQMRFECPKSLVIVQGNTAYEGDPRSKTAIKCIGPKIPGMAIWYKAAELSPWMSGKILLTLRFMSDDWTEEFYHDPNTGKTGIFVTCTYTPTQTAYRLVVDLESKLITSAEMLKHGLPCLDASTFIYNPVIATTTFELPPGYAISNQTEIDTSQTLFQQAEALFQQKQYHEAITVYTQVYETYPQLDIAQSALSMIGICYDWLKQLDQSILYFEKAMHEYPARQGWSEPTYFYLGSAYQRVGRIDDAVWAYKQCLEIGGQERDDARFPFDLALGRLQHLGHADYTPGEQLFRQGETQFHQEKNYEKAIELYQQAYEQTKVSDIKVAHNAMMMTGLSYRRLEQHDQAIAMFEQAVQEHPDLKGWVEATLFYLAREYEEAGLTDKALGAYQQCIEAGTGVRKPEQFPLDLAAAAIKRLGGKR